ncbi:hypothetical protein C1H46_029911 [Malus baccata]|uniref:Uncharacterized protein n=1 Tax=Malus baccata TaxID=106549 RepID=A0A540LDG9_MALBA|nr:hypothetical protein C1H46_029911 [Malus baccata]
MEMYEIKPSPATKSSIDGLERVRLDSSEASGESVICTKLFEPGVEVIHLPYLHFITEIALFSGWRPVTCVPCAATRCLIGYFPSLFVQKMENSLYSPFEASQWKIG